MADTQRDVNPSDRGAASRRGRIVRRYFLIFATLIGGAIAISVLLEMTFRFLETRHTLEVEHLLKAELAAMSIENHIESVAEAVRRTARPRQDRITQDFASDLRELLRNVPSIRDVVALSMEGREDVRYSRIGPSVANTQADHGARPYFEAARSGKTYFGPIVFPSDSFEPRMIIAVPIELYPGKIIGVLASDVNVSSVLKFVQEIRAGETGYAYVVSETGALVAHPDLHLVLQRKNLSDLPQVAALRKDDSQHSGIGVYKNLNGQRVLVSHVQIPTVGWTVLVERPLSEAYAPFLMSLARTGGLLLVVVLISISAAVLLARRVVRPIEVLRRGAAELGAGNLDARLALNTGDEFEDLAEDFNRMAGQLRESYSTLERKVEERTHQLEMANLAKSRFLATASHDLRQPLHALGLFVAQLSSLATAEERNRIVERINASVMAMNELFSALLDISKLDAGVMAPRIALCPVSHVFKRIDTTFAETARAKNLSFRIVPTNAWVRTDSVLLERILLNLVSNAVRYTVRGGIVVGCRRRNGYLRLEVYDTGPGIPEDQHKNIYGEFYRLGHPEQDQSGGLGLGLAIVDRLCRLLDHPIELKSTLGKGSRFSVTMPQVTAPMQLPDAPAPVHASMDVVTGKLVVVIDDDPLVLDGMGGLFRSWGCRVASGATENAANIDLARYHRVPDLIVSDYRMSDGQTGIEVIRRLRSTYSTQIPAFLISGDTNPEPLLNARAEGYHLLHKPVEPMALRAMISRLLLPEQTVL